MRPEVLIRCNLSHFLNSGSPPLSIGSYSYKLIACIQLHVSLVVLQYCTLVRLVQLQQIELSSVVFLALYRRITTSSILINVNNAVEKI